MKHTSGMIKWSILLLFCASVFGTYAQTSPKTTIAVLNIDSRGLPESSETLGYMVRLELEKTGLYNVLDRYEANELLVKSPVDIKNCFSKTCLTSAGKLLKVEKMLGGSAELVGDRVVIELRLVDVATGTVEKSDATEYINIHELQKMLRISVQKIAGVKPDELLVNQLIDYDVPIQSPRSTLRLNGPRMGFAYTTGMNAQILQAKRYNGGFDMSPVTFQFGWQQEFQYISSGNFQALVENIFLISGLESGVVIPSYTPLLGFRFGKNAWEFAFGPVFKETTTASGYYDAAGNWHLVSEGMPANALVETRLDSRGTAQLSTGLVIAAGRTFHSGYLNIPVNIYVAPDKNGISYGANFGFNVQKKDKTSRKMHIDSKKND